MGEENITDDLAVLKKNLNTDNNTHHAVPWLLFAIVLLGIGFGGFWLLRPAEQNSSILIYNAGIEWAVSDGQKQWVSEATDQAISAYLDVSESVHILGSGDGVTVARGGEDWVLSGTLSPDPSQQSAIVLRLVLQSNRNDDQKHDVEIKGMATALNDLAERSSAQVLTLLDLRQLSADQQLQARAEVPATGGAQEAYGEGMLSLEKYDGRTAVAHFQQAINASGDHPIVHSALARAWSQLGYNERARQAVQNAYDVRGELSRKKQLEIEGEYYATHEEFDRAIDVYKALKEFHPLDLSYRLRASELLLKTGDAGTILDSIAEMRSLNAPMGDDPRIDIIEARYWHQTGNYAKGAELSDIAISKSQETRDTAILAQAYLGAIENESERKREYLAQAQKLFEEIDSPRFQSAILSELAQQARYDNQVDASISLYREALALSESVGDESQAFFAQHGLAIALDLKDELSASYDLKKKTLAYHSARGAKAREAIVYENIGISLFKLGRLSEAEDSFAKALEIFHVVGDSIGIAWAPYHLSRIKSRQGDLGKSEKLAAQSVLNSEKNPEGQLELNAKFEVAQILFYQGRYEEAETQFTVLRTAFAESDNVISSGESALMLARIALRKGNFDSAQDYMREAAKIYEAGGTVYYVLDALIVRNDLAYLAFTEDIDTSCSALRLLAADSEYALIAMRARLRAIRCDVLQGALRDEQANIHIATIETEAKTLGMFEVLLDAGLIRAQIFDNNAARAKATVERNRIAALATANGWASAVNVAVKN